MRSKNKSTLRTALIYIGIFICGAVLVVLLLSFFDNTLNGTLREWFYRGYMTEYYDSEMATDYVQPDWIAIKGLAFRLALAVVAFCVIIIGIVSRLRLNAERRRIGNAVGQFMLSDAKSKLMRSQTLLREETARKNDLVMYLAHDLKTPLASVIGYLTLLRDEQQISPELREKYLSITLDKAERLEDLINEFFEITRFNLSTVTLDYSSIDLVRLLEQLRFEFMPMLKEKSLTCTLCAPDALPIICDAGKMQRVFDNLLRNAVLYSYPDTEIVINAQLDGDSVSVSVVNRGNTIPEEKLRRFLTHREDIMKKFISVCLCICIFAAQLSGCSDMSFPGSSGPTDEEKLEKIRTSDEYPEILVETAEKCPQTLDYVYNYPELKDRRFDIDLSADAQSGTVPLFIQWDERWGYEPYGSGFIGTSGCGPTCLSMAAVYLTKNAAYSPLFVARLAEKNGYCVPGNGSSWTLISEGSALLGLSATELPLWEQSMKNALDSGAVIILALGPGDFTSSGHFVVLTGYDSCGFTVNDPNSPDNSAKHWTYDRLSPQISNLWSLLVAI